MRPARLAVAAAHNVGVGLFSVLPFRFLLVAVLVSSLILHVGYRRAEAIAPAIPFMAMVLSAVATGSAIGYMSYNANGKEIYVKMKGALKDGVRVTKDWVQRRNILVIRVAYTSELAPKTISTKH